MLDRHLDQLKGTSGRKCQLSIPHGRLVEIADSRFQDELLQGAKRAGKVSEDYQIPERARNNRPERLEKLMTSYRHRGLFPDFPFGTDLNPEEVVLRKALKKLKRAIQRKRFPIPRLAEIRKVIASRLSV